MTDDVWVRARDGALYKNPLLVFDEGFICFDPEDNAEIVLWITEEEIDGPPKVNVVTVLQRVLGFGAGVQMELPDGRILPLCSAFVDSVGYRTRSRRVVPLTDPWEYANTISYHFKLILRIPRPLLHEGIERYIRNTSGGTVWDPPVNQMDANALEMPE